MLHPDSRHAACLRSQPKPLVRVTVKCPCGRRSSHQVVEQGAPAPPLGCDAACERERRKARLADAFGVDDPEQYTAVHDRNRCAAGAACRVQGSPRDHGDSSQEPRLGVVLLVLQLYTRGAVCQALTSALRVTSANSRGPAVVASAGSRCTPTACCWRRGGTPTSSRACSATWPHSWRSRQRGATRCRRCLVRCTHCSPGCDPLVPGSPFAVICRRQCREINVGRACS